MTPWLLSLYVILFGLAMLVPCATAILAYSAWFLIRLNLIHKTDPGELPKPEGQ